MALYGQNFIRPGSTGRNFERPKIHYFYYPQRVYTRDPAGGPLRGGTTLTVIGEGLNGYGLMIDKINQQIIADNLVDKLREGKLWQAPNPNPGPLVLAPAQTQTLTLSLSPTLLLTLHRPLQVQPRGQPSAAQVAALFGRRGAQLAPAQRPLRLRRARPCLGAIRHV